MNKKDAIKLLGGTLTSAAKEIGITPTAVSRWPENLSSAIRDRVQAALYRRSNAAQQADGKKQVVQQ